MRKWPAWVPLPNAWMSAIFLLFLVFGLNFLYGFILSLQSGFYHLPNLFEDRSIYYWQYLSANHFFDCVLNGGFIASPGFALFLLFLLAIPFVAIAYAHHLLHALLDRIAPEAPKADVSPTRGFIPGMMSWWEALFGWTTIQLSTLLSFVVLTIFSTRASIPNLIPFGSANSPGNLLASLVGYAVWISIAAYLYQFEYSIRQRLIASGRSC